MRNKSFSLDNKSFERYFKQLFPSLTYYAFKIIRDYDTAKDVVHEAFTKLWENRKNIDTQGNVKSYLYRSVHNLSLNYIRDNKKFADIENSPEAGEYPIETGDKIETAELEQAIIETIESMPERMKQVFILSRYEGLTYKEISQKLGISDKTVEVHISRALKILRDNLKNFIDTE